MTGAVGGFGPVTPRKVLVTGASGFFGSAIVRRLRREHEVVTASRSQGVDVLDAGALARAARGCATIVHAAAQVVGSEGDLVATNVDGTRHALDAARRENAAFILISSAGAAGPRTAYGRTKAAAEALVEDHAPSLPGAAILRFYNLYGDGDPRGVVARFLREDPIILEGDGTAVRDFLHVDDAAEAVACSLVPRGLVRADVGTGRGVSILQLAKLFNKRVLQGPAPGAQIMHSVAIPHAIPGWSPKVELEAWIHSRQERP
ncbi:MAG TPA: NAD(P)-dependent oxidoreductase [Candidatus Thermoplasmatota archaeon]|nr:NAD(P)-dependent oxidoreductase [Candidatus Thermoplasmatota archaeon]